MSRSDDALRRLAESRSGRGADDVLDAARDTAARQMRSQRRTMAVGTLAVVVVAVAAAMWLAGDEGGSPVVTDPPTPTETIEPTTTTTSTTEPEPVESPASHAERDTLFDPVETAGFANPSLGGTGLGNLMDLRVGAHDTFDRIVLEFDFEGVGEPRYRVEYVDPPISAGASSRELEIEGEAFLEVLVHGATASEVYGAPADAFLVDRLAAPEAELVSEAVRSYDFEMSLGWAIGLREQRFPFTVEYLDDPARLVIDIHHGRGASHAPTDGDQALVDAFLAFAAGTGDFDDLPLADEVALGLGWDLHMTRQGSALVDADAWTIEALFRARRGEFSALDELARAAEADTVVTVGSYPHCAAPPITPPPELVDHRRVSVQADLESRDTCLQWWAVDLFVDDAGQVAGVTMDLWEP